MKQVKVTGVRKAELVDVPTPKVFSDWVLVKVNITPMCTEYKGFVKGEDWNGLGHEAVGEVAEVAQPCTVETGDRVLVMPQYPCGICDLCIKGDYVYCERSFDFEKHTGSPYGSSTYAQYILKPSWLLKKIPDDISDEMAGLAFCALGPTYGAFDEMGGLNPFNTVLITGLGPVGLGGVVNAKFFGSKVIGVDALEYRRNLAIKLGADAVFDPGDKDILKKIKDFCKGTGPDIAADCAGVPAAHRLCIDAVARRAKVAFVGECNENTNICASPDLIRKGMTVYGTWFYNINLVPQIFEIIRKSPDASKLITHVIPMSKIQEAFTVSASPEHGKILLRPWE